MSDNYWQPEADIVMKDESQGSVTTHINFGGIFSDHCTTSLLLNLLVKELLKSWNIWSYRQYGWSCHCVCIGIVQLKMKNSPEVLSLLGNSCHWLLLCWCWLGLGNCQTDVDRIWLADCHNQWLTVDDHMRRHFASTPFFFLWQGHIISHSIDCLVWILWIFFSSMKYRMLTSLGKYFWQLFWAAESCVTVWVLTSNE